MNNKISIYAVKGFEYYSGEWSSWICENTITLNYSKVCNDCNELSRKNAYSRYEIIEIKETI